ncbi:MAG: NADH-quinone oxidoreductase subunit M [Bacteroides sp.]|nr:MAG: NADH-quinone oxidoreductase subunit M [Bacteroides sp.]
MHNLILLLIPIIGIIFILSFSNKYSKYIALSTSFVQTTHIIYILFYYRSLHKYFLEFKIIENINCMIGIDNISLKMLTMTIVSFFLIVLSTFQYKENNKLIYLCALISIFGVIGVLISFDTILFYVFWEISLIPIYISAFYTNNFFKIRKNVEKFLFYSISSGFIIITAIIYVYSKSGQHNFSFIEYNNVLLNINEKILLFFVLIIGFGIKIPILILHEWQRKIYYYAPNIISLILSTILSKMGIYGLIRFIIPLYNNIDNTSIKIFLFIYLIFSIIYSSIFALNQKNIKYMSAYSSIAYNSLILICLFIGGFSSVNSIILQMINHSIIIIGIFTIYNIIYLNHKVTNIGEYNGIINKYPILGIYIIVLMLNNIGFPLTGSFISEIMIFNIIFKYNIMIGILCSFIIIFSAIYMNNIYLSMLGHNSNYEENHNIANIKSNELLVIILSIIIIFLMGLFSDIFVKCYQDCFFT